MKVPTADVTAELLGKYDRPGPRYTSYPTAVEFHDGFGAADYASHLATANERDGEPLSLYVHVPFCAERCTFCGCNVIITRRDDIADRYLAGVDRESALLASHLPDRRRLAQLHWGGGTPTSLDVDQMGVLMRSITSRFTLDEGAEVAIEVDPRVTTPKQMEALRELGFNRLSMGVQDFDAQVQAAINRNQTESQTVALVEHARSLGFDSVNVDLIYGLPHQTRESYRRTLEATVAIRPDRLAVYSYAHVPWIKGNQHRIRLEDLPERSEKLALFGLAIENFVGAGYEPIGMDHFALPDDELAVAARAGELHRNFMGYTVKPAPDMVGLGVSSIADVAGCFAQNTKKLTEYERMLEAGQLPVTRGYALVGDDALRREVISRLMCNMSLDIPAVESRFGIDFAATFAPELEALREPEAEGFLTLSSERIEMTPIGRLFIRNVCMTFDTHLRRRTGDRPTFSQTI